MNPAEREYGVWVRRAGWTVLLVVVCLAGISCGSTTKAKALAENGAAMFHSQLDTEQYTAIYAGADDKFKNATSEADLTKLLTAVRTKLGMMHESKLVSWHVGFYTGTGETVMLVYDTKFADGAGQEQFSWHIQNGVATLYGYRINSNDLISK